MNISREVIDLMDKLSSDTGCQYTEAYKVALMVEANLIAKQANKLKSTEIKLIKEQIADFKKANVLINDGGSTPPALEKIAIELANK